MVASLFTSIESPNWDFYNAQILGLSSFEYSFFGLTSTDLSPELQTTVLPDACTSVSTYKTRKPFKSSPKKF
jgi:hypothetical protein